MKTLRYLYSLLLVLILTSCSFSQKKELLTGADILVRNHLGILYGKKIGIVTNQTAILKNGTHLVDTLHSIKSINITALFGPEHGIRGTEPAGKKIQSSIDPKTKIPVYSLYGVNHKPTKEMLKGINLLIYDIQDIGTRFYTYISTLFYILQAAAENNIPLLILDRPNPIDGVTIEGPILKKELKSFVGIAPIPIRYGMTASELADFFVGEGLLGEKKPYFKIIKMEGWERNSYFDEYDIEWINPSPNIPSYETALVYPGTCLIEGINVSEGRGTLKPFITIGAPYIKSDELIEEMERGEIAGVKLSPVEFIPIKISGMSDNPRYRDVTCYGISIEVTDKKKFRSVNFGIHLLCSLIKLYPNNFMFNSFFDKLSGDATLKEQILNGKTAEEIISGWEKETEEFKLVRKKYLIY